MKALKALKPGPRWLQVTACAGSVLTGLLVALWWETGELPSVSFVVFSITLALVSLEIYTWRTRPDGEVYEQKLHPEALPVHPPGIAEVLVTLIVPRGRSEALLGDFEERFHRHIETRGLKMARALYWAEVLRSILPMVVAKAKRLGVIAVIAELWRRSHS